MSVGQVEALAAAHDRVVGARARIQKHESFGLFLVTIGKAEAAARLMSRIRELELDLTYLETVLVALTSKVYHEFNGTLIARADKCATTASEHVT